MVRYVSVQGERAPAIGLGTWMLSGEACERAVEHALSIGYRHLDTAQMYGNEAEVGRGVRASGVGRESVFLTTKITPEHFARDKLLRAAGQCLRRLGTDYVDLLLLHWPNPDVPLEESIAALAELREAGRVRHIGVSNFPPSMVERAGRTARIFCNQVEYHPYLSQRKLLAQAAELDYLLTAYCPIARGRVSKDPVIRDIAAAHGRSPAQVTLRWLIQQEKVAAIPKAAGQRHQTENLDIFDFELSDEQMRRVHERGSENRIIDPVWAPHWER